MTLNKRTLAELIIDFDRNYPGERDSPIEIPAETWQLILAVAIDEEAEQE